MLYLGIIGESERARPGVMKYEYILFLYTDVSKKLNLTLILKIFISDAHIDDNFWEKNLCHSGLSG